MTPSTIRFISIPASVLSRKDLLPIDALLYGRLRFHQASKAECWPSLSHLAAGLHCDVRTIVASIKRLAAAELVEVLQIEGRTAYRVRIVKEARYLRVTDAVLRRAGLSPLAKLVLAMIAFGIQGNEDRHAFARQDTMAAWLGCSRRSIIRAVESLTAAGLIEARRRGPRSNQYALTPQGEAAIVAKVAQQAGKRCDTFAPPYKKAENESFKELKETPPRSLPSAGLSGCRLTGNTPRTKPASTPHEQAEERLKRVGVHPKVAAALVHVQHHPPASIEQAIDNALLSQASHRQKGLDRLKPFSVAAYVVGTLNQARREAHLVKPSSILAKAKALHDQRKAWKPMTDSDFEERRRRCIEGLRRAAS